MKPVRICVACEASRHAAPSILIRRIYLNLCFSHKAELIWGNNITAPDRSSRLLKSSVNETYLLKAQHAPTAAGLLAMGKEMSSDSITGLLAAREPLKRKYDNKSKTLIRVSGGTLSSEGLMGYEYLWIPVQSYFTINYILHCD